MLEPDEIVGEAERSITSSECDLYDEEGGLKSADQAGEEGIRSMFWRAGMATTMLGQKDYT